MRVPAGTIKPVPHCVGDAGPRFAAAAPLRSFGAALSKTKTLFPAPITENFADEVGQNLEFLVSLNTSCSYCAGEVLDEGRD